MPRGVPKNPMSEAERKDARRETQRRYREKNGKQYVATKTIKCSCGGTYRKYDKNIHMKTNKHQFFELEQSIIELYCECYDVSLEDGREKLEKYYDKKHLFSQTQKQVELDNNKLINALKNKIAEQTEESMEAENIKSQAEDTTRCSGCDEIINEDGCGCRIVACNHCGDSDNMYNMFHRLKEYDEFEYLSLNDKLNGMYCSECYDLCNENEEEDVDESNEDNSGDESC